MVETNLLSEEEIKYRTNQLFTRVFVPVFASNCGNPIDMELTKHAFRDRLGKLFTEELEEAVEKFYYQADNNNVSNSIF